MTQLIKGGTTLTWSLMNGYKDESIENIETILSEAFQVWSDNLNIVFKKLSYNNQDAQIKIGFYSGKHGECSHEFDGVKGVLAHSTYPLMTRVLFIHFDSDEPWLFTSKITFLNYFTKRPVFKIVAIHEIGHVIGLCHRDVLNSVMNKKYARLITKPSSEDIAIVAERLGRNPNAKEIKDDPKILTILKVYYQEFTILGIILMLTLIYFVFRFTKSKISINKFTKSK